MVVKVVVVVVCIVKRTTHPGLKDVATTTLVTDVHQTTAKYAVLITKIIRGCNNSWDNQDLIYLLSAKAYFS